MAKVRCTQRIRDKRGRISHYMIEDTNGNSTIVPTNKLKYAINNKKVNVDNLKMTSDGRLILYEKIESGSNNDEYTKPFYYNYNYNSGLLNTVESILHEVMDIDTFKICAANEYQTFDKLKSLVLRSKLIGVKASISKLQDRLYMIIINNDITVIAKGNKIVLPESISNILYSPSDNTTISNMHIENLIFEGIDSSRVQDMSSIFKDLTIKNIYGLQNFDTRNVVKVSSMFQGGTFGDLNLSKFDFSNVIDATSMFSSCKCENLDLRETNFSRLKRAKNMFNCTLAKNINMQSVDMSSLETADALFNDCTCEILNISGLKTSSLKDMKNIFRGIEVGELNISKLNTTFVTNMHSAFSYAKIGKLIGLDKISFNSAATLDWMFSGCEIQEIVFGDNCQVTRSVNAPFMFYDTTIGRLDLSKFSFHCFYNLTAAFSNSNIGELITKDNQIDLSTCKSADRMFMLANIKDTHGKIYVSIKKSASNTSFDDRLKCEHESSIELVFI